MADRLHIRPARSAVATTCSCIIGHMDLIEAIRTRRSTAAVSDDAPDDAELARCVALAAHAPDHAGLRPWRLATVRGAARNRLGEAWVEGFGDPPGSEAARKTANKPLRSPLLIGVIGQLVPDHPKVPEWEQIAAIGAMVATLELVLFDAGYTAMWRTGPAIDLQPVQQVMGVAPGERLLGWLYVGRTADEATLRPDPDVSDRLTDIS